MLKRIECIGIGLIFISVGVKLLVKGFFINNNIKFSPLFKLLRLDKIFVVVVPRLIGFGFFISGLILVFIALFADNDRLKGLTAL